MNQQLSLLLSSVVFSCGLEYLHVIAAMAGQLTIVTLRCHDIKHPPSICPILCAIVVKIFQLCVMLRHVAT